MNTAYGVGAVQIGVPMDLYRLNNNSNGDYIQPTNYLLTMPVDREPMKRGDPGYESSSRTDVFWFDLMLNGNVVILGDILILNDPYYGTNYVSTPGAQQFIGLCMVAESPIKNYLAARLDFYGGIYRPSLTANNSGYWDQTAKNELPLILINGSYALGNPGEQASLIPIGHMPFRNRGEIFDSVKTANIPTKEQRFIFIPPLTGITILPGDRIINQNGDQYIIQGNYIQTVGTVGYQFLVEKLVSGSGSS